MFRALNSVQFVLRDLLSIVFAANALVHTFYYHLNLHEYVSVLRCLAAV